MVEILESIHRIEIPTPFPVGNVNCYLIEGSPLTLIDTGPYLEEGVTLIDKALGKSHYSVTDIERVLLTHGHVDHVGNTRAIQEAVRASGHQEPEVWIHEMDSHRITDYEGYIERRMQAYWNVIISGGVPEEIVAEFSTEGMMKYFGQFGQSVDSVSVFYEEQQFESGIGPIDYLWTPGHSLGSVCFLAHEREIVFCGDHVLGTISSNPSLDFEGRLGISMQRYLLSLDAIEPFSHYIPLPGHRDPIFDLGVRLNDLREDYRNKLRRTKDLLSNEPQSLFELSRNLYGEYARDSLILALAETHDLVRLLDREGEAILTTKDDVIVVKSV
ncbi:MBL fold metallo-hydrolase [Candidatus Thorarchaeota archaeon]|nr:MAG: MBL fold metallo-hydrolase [Candidatus Thorarchaeota archaeon]